MILKRILLLKILYYTFFAAIVLIALVIFMEIIDFALYDEYLSGFFRRVLRLLDF